MSDSLSSRDWDLLSAYLDERLDEKELQAFKLRLEQEAELAKALMDMRQIRSLMGRMPVAKTPKRFTLTREMTEQKRGIFLPRFASWSTVSALASVLFAFVILSDLGGLIIEPQSRELAAPAEAMADLAAADETAPQAPEIAEESQTGEGVPATDDAVSQDMVEAASEDQFESVAEAEEEMDDSIGALEESAEPEEERDSQEDSDSSAKIGGNDEGGQDPQLVSQPENFGSEEDSANDESLSISERRGKISVPSEYLLTIEVLLALVAITSGWLARRARKA